jgi:cytochrome b561
MSSPANPPRYTDVAIALHWLLALAILTSFCVGMYMADLKLSPLRIRLFNWHKWAGISILLLSAVRLAWRVRHAPPPVVDPMSPLQRRLADIAHKAMYALFFIVPLVGWAYSSASGFQVVWFGHIPLPDFVPKDKELADFLEDAHAALAWTLGAIVVLHAAAALEHHFLRRDGVLRRMLPAIRRAGGPGAKG